MEDKDMTRLFGCALSLLLVGFCSSALSQPEAVDPADQLCTGVQDEAGLGTQWGVDRCEYAQQSKYSREGVEMLTGMTGGIPDNAYTYKTISIALDNQPAGSLKLLAYFGGWGEPCTPTLDHSNPQYIIIKNTQQVCPGHGSSWNVGVSTPMDWGGIAYGPPGLEENGESLGWRISASLTRAQVAYAEKIDLNAGVRLDGYSWGGTTVFMQPLLMKDEYWRSKVTIVRGSVPGTMFTRHDLDGDAINKNGQYWRCASSFSNSCYANNQPASDIALAWKSFDPEKVNYLSTVYDNASKVKNVYFSATGSELSDSAVFFDTDFFRVFCNQKKIACFGTWHNNGHAAAEPGIYMPFNAVFSGVYSDNRLDRILPVFTNSTGNNYSRTRGHHNLGLEWMSGSFNVDTVDKVSIPIRYVATTNFGASTVPGMVGETLPPQPTSITVDVTLRKVKNFALTKGRNLKWNFYPGAGAGAPVTGTTIVTTAGEVTIPAVPLSSSGNFSTLEIVPGAPPGC